MRLNLFILLILVNVCGVSQTLITSSDTVADCLNTSSSFNSNVVPNFFDSDQDSLYTANESEVITICPDLGASKLEASFDTTGVFDWDVDNTDTLYIYDGNSINSPLIGAYNSGTNPAGFGVTSSWNNPSGCLTFQFVSDGAVQDTGWAALVQCYSPPQPFQVHMEGYINGSANGANDINNDLNPLDTGYIDICLGDSILFVSKPYFPNDPSITGMGGYDQIGTYTSMWRFTDGTELLGDSVWFKPSSQIGIVVELIVSDNLSNESINSIVRVSTTPSFQSLTISSDTLCLDQDVLLTGGGVNSDLSIGSLSTTGSVEIGGNFSNTTFLPDGNNSNYTTSIAISGFTPGATIQSSQDINRVCLNMEHSWLGDLEMTLTCPNGQTSLIFNSYSGTAPGSLAPGGFGGGSIFLGGANEVNLVDIGVCEEYCFSELPAAQPSWDVLAGGLGIPTVAASGPTAGFMVEPGMYNPEESFFPALQGCPINGVWTITVRDNLLSDNGYICEWGIYFDAALNPNNETYNPIITSVYWSPSPDIINSYGDTSISVIPPSIGDHEYVFNIEDSYGCTYDTVVNVNVLVPGSIETPLSGCVGIDGGVQFTNTYSPEGGVWLYPPEVDIKFPATFINQGFTSDIPGVHIVTFVDSQCGDTLTEEITFLPLPYANLVESDTICRGDSMLLTVETSDPNNIVWSLNGDSISTSALIVIEDDGIYTADVTNQCGSASAVFELFIEDCVIPNVITPNGDGQNDVFYTNIAETYSDTHITIFNRWGRKVYENENYDNTWNGVNNGGGDLAAGVYYYVLSYNEGSKNEKGFITLMK